MLDNRLSRRRIYAPVFEKNLCNHRMPFTMTHRLISMLHLDHKDYACYFMLSKWQSDSEEPLTICPQTIEDWAFERGDFYQTLVVLGRSRPELCGESLIDFWHDPVTNGWQVKVRSISQIMDKMASVLRDG